MDHLVQTPQLQVEVNWLALTHLLLCTGVFHPVALVWCEGKMETIIRVDAGLLRAHLVSCDDFRALNVPNEPVTIAAGNCTLWPAEKHLESDLQTAWATTQSSFADSTLSGFSAARKRTQPHLLCHIAQSSLKCAAGHAFRKQVGNHV